MLDEADFDSIDAAIESRQLHVAAGRLRALWRRHPTLPVARFVHDRCRRLPAHFPVLIRKRLAILRSFTVEPLVPLLKTEALMLGVDFDVWVSGYDDVHLQLLDGSSGLHAFQPEMLLLWLAPREAQSSWRRSLQSFRSTYGGPVVFHADGGALATDDRPANDPVIGEPDVFVLPHRALIARHGPDRWYDMARGALNGLAVRSPMHIHLVRAWLKLLIPLSGRRSKVLVTDLDDTLWQGVTGEDGPTGVRPNLALQDTLRRLQHQGVLLAISSRSAPEDVAPLLDHHRSMVLSRDDFAAAEIGWRDKASSLRDIAAELNVGLESLAFLDSSPFEREQIRVSLPEVVVIDLPDTTEQFAAAVADAPTLQSLVASPEDARRSVLYAEQHTRTTALARAATLEEFLHSLDLRVLVSAVDATTALRAAQISQRTTQFTLSTRRYGQHEIVGCCDDPRYAVWIFRAVDRFGDNGHIGLVLARRHADELRLEAFALSCRALGRGIELAMLHAVVVDSDISRVTALFVETARNAPCAAFLAEAGFVRPASPDEAWILELAKSRPRLPGWISLSQSTLPSHQPGYSDRGARAAGKAP